MRQKDKDKGKVINGKGGQEERERINTSCYQHWDGRPGGGHLTRSSFYPSSISAVRPRLCFSVQGFSPSLSYLLPGEGTGSMQVSAACLHPFNQVVLLSFPQRRAFLWPAGRDYIHLFSRAPRHVHHQQSKEALKLWGTELVWSPSLQFSFMRFTSYHFLNRLRSWLATCRRQKMATMVCGPLRGKLAWESTEVQCDTSGRFLPWTHNPTGPATLLLLNLMEPVYLFTSSEEAQNQVHQTGKDPVGQCD